MVRCDLRSLEGITGIFSLNCDTKSVPGLFSERDWYENALFIFYTLYARRAAFSDREEWFSKRGERNFAKGNFRNSKTGAKPISLLAFGGHLVEILIAPETFQDTLQNVLN